MQAVNAKIGRITSIAQAAEGVSLTGPRGKEIPQSNRDAFAMYDLRDDLAQSFDCENRLHPQLADAKLARSTDFGHYVGAVFRLKAGDVKGDSVATLWSDESGFHSGHAACRATDRRIAGHCSVLTEVSH